MASTSQCCSACAGGKGAARAREESRRPRLASKRCLETVAGVWRAFEGILKYALKRLRAHRRRRESGTAFGAVSALPTDGGGCIKAF